MTTGSNSSNNGDLSETRKPALTIKEAAAILGVSHEQKTKGDLERQVGRVTKEALLRNYSIIAVFDEVGSGMNEQTNKAK